MFYSPAVVYFRERNRVIFKVRGEAAVRVSEMVVRKERRPPCLSSSARLTSSLLYFGEALAYERNDAHTQLSKRPHAPSNSHLHSACLQCSHRCVHCTVVIMIILLHVDTCASAGLPCHAGCPRQGAYLFKLRCRRSFL